jgi:hypothetical protein
MRQRGSGVGERLEFRTAGGCTQQRACFACDCRELRQELGESLQRRRRILSRRYIRGFGRPQVQHQRKEAIDLSIDVRRRVWPGVRLRIAVNEDRRRRGDGHEHQDDAESHDAIAHAAPTE